MRHIWVIDGTGIRVGDGLWVLWETENGLRGKRYRPVGDSPEYTTKYVTTAEACPELTRQGWTIISEEEALKRLLA